MKKLLALLKDPDTRDALARFRLVPMIAEREKSTDPDDGAMLIECPDGIVVYLDEAGHWLPGVEFDKTGTPVAGGVVVECGRQLARNGACQRCGGTSWVPAGPAVASTFNLLLRAEELEVSKQRDVMRLIGGLD